MTDGAEWVPVPLGTFCMNCHEQFRAGDNGAIMPTGYAQHRECSLRSVMGGIGHLVNHQKYCRGTIGADAGLTYRESAILVWWHHHGMPIDEQLLEGARMVSAMHKRRPET